MLQVASYPPMTLGYLPREKVKSSEGFDPTSSIVSCRNRTISYDNMIYRNIVDLLKGHPKVKDDLLQLARAVNFFFNGDGFTVIDKPKKFKIKYETTIRDLSSSDEDMNNPLFGDLIGAGVRETKHISRPHYRKDGKFVFYAERSFLPYRITCRFSDDPDKLPAVDCNILDLKKMDLRRKTGSSSSVTG